MSMFYNYDNIDENYIPNNCTPEEINSYIKLDLNLPYEIYNIKDEFVGYAICYGDTCKIPINLNKQIYVEDDAIIYDLKGQYPKEDDIGKKGQKAYNIKDFISWTCYGRSKSKYIWKKDNCFIYPKNGVKQINLIPELDNFSIKVNIQNFRYESIKTFNFENDLNTYYTIDEQLQELLHEGIYYVSISLITEDYSRIIDSYLLQILNKYNKE